MMPFIWRKTVVESKGQTWYIEHNYMLVIAWAFAGIAVKQAGTPVVAIAAWVATALVVLMLLVGVVRQVWRNHASRVINWWKL